MRRRIGVRAKPDCSVLIGGWPIGASMRRSTGFGDTVRWPFSKRFSVTHLRSGPLGSLGVAKCCACACRTSLFILAIYLLLICPSFAPILLLFCSSLLYQLALYSPLLLHSPVIHLLANRYSQRLQVRQQIALHLPNHSTQQQLIATAHVEGLPTVAISTRTHRYSTSSLQPRPPLLSLSLFSLLSPLFSLTHTPRRGAAEAPSDGSGGRQAPRQVQQTVT